MRRDETRLVLIRHGESRAQVDGRVTGHDTCSGLSDFGRRQAEALRDRFHVTAEIRDAYAIYTSVLPRAIETAEIIQPSGADVVQVRPECEWCELHPGQAEGLTWDALRERFPPDGDQDDPFRRRLPGMETWAELYVRVGARLKSATAAHRGECLVVVAHGGTVGATFIALGGVPISHGVSLTRGTANASITEWLWSGGHWCLLRYNDTAHLAALEGSG